MMAQAKKMQKKLAEKPDSFAGLKKALLKKYRELGPGKALGKEFDKVKNKKK